METKQQGIPLVELATRYKLIIPDYVEKKIRHLCNRIWDKEWSGALFYNVEGSFEDDTLALTCSDIFVMDIGSSTYTEFDMSPDIMTYMTEHPELMECQIGLIHSHNTFSAFFSSTDIKTLREEAQDRNHFLSLIVNNAGTYTAAITRKIKTKREFTDNITYKSFNDEVKETKEIYEQELEELQYFYLDITKEGKYYTFSEVDERLEEIKKAKESKKNNDIKDPLKDLSVKYEPKWFDKKYKDKGWNYQDNLPFANEIDTSFMESEPLRNIPETVEDKEPSCSPDIIKSLVTQLITGSVMIPNESKVDLNKWANSLKSVVERRFGKGKEGISEYKSFIEIFLDYLVWYTEDPELVNMVDENTMASIIAYSMHEYISTKLPTNEYTKICLEALNLYM